MKLYSASQASSFIGKSINYQHMASDSICGPARVVAVHAGSDQIIVSSDSYTGRTIGLLLCVTMLEPVLMSLTAGKVE